MRPPTSTPGPAWCPLARSKRSSLLHSGTLPVEGSTIVCHRVSPAPDSNLLGGNAPEPPGLQRIQERLAEIDRIIQTQPSYITVYGSDRAGEIRPPVYRGELQVVFQH